jgi:hypothetical protein
MKRYTRMAAMMIIATTFLFSPSVLTQQQVSKNQKTINLQGKWDDGGDVVNLIQNGVTVTAKWEKLSSCKHGKTEESFPAEFKATLAGNKLTGEAKYCNYGDESAKGAQWGPIQLTVSPDGNTLSAIQTMYNVTTRGTREVKVEFEMKRICKPDPKESCGELALAAGRAVNNAIRTTVASAASYATLKQNLSSQLDQLRNAFCDNPLALAKLDEVQRELDSLNYQSGSSNLPNNLRLVRMEKGLSDLGSHSCKGSLPVCKSGEKRVPPGDETAKDSIVDALEDVILHEKVKDKKDKYEQIKGFWENIKAGSCVRSSVIGTIKIVANEKKAFNGYSENCPLLCKEAVEWFMDIIPNPNQYHRKYFMETCDNSCNTTSKR